MEENKTYLTWTFDKILLYEIATNVFLSDELCLKVAAEPILLMRCSAPLARGRRWHHHTLSFLSLVCEQVFSLGKNRFPCDMAGQWLLWRTLVEAEFPPCRSLNDIWD